MRIVAFGYRQRVGKDTAAKFLISRIRSQWPKIKVKRLGLADRLKDLAHEAYGWAGLMDKIYYENHPEEKDKELATIGKSPRQMWLEMGYFMNQICPVTFVQLGLQGVDADILVCSDLRRKAEAEFFHKFTGSFLYEIRRPGIPKLESKLTGHPAYMLDAELDDYPDWDGCVTNDGTLKQFNQKINDLAEIVTCGYR